GMRPAVPAEAQNAYRDVGLGGEPGDVGPVGGGLPVVGAVHDIRPDDGDHLRATKQSAKNPDTAQVGQQMPIDQPRQHDDPGALGVLIGNTDILLTMADDPYVARSIFQK